MTSSLLPEASSDGACTGITILVIDDSATVRSAAFAAAAPTDAQSPIEGIAVDAVCHRPVR